MTSIPTHEVHAAVGGAFCEHREDISHIAATLNGTRAQRKLEMPSLIQAERNIAGSIRAGPKLWRFST
jgi:hypothetical protein